MTTSSITPDSASLCFQCGKCSAGCPVAGEMDLLPHQIIHLRGLGMKDEALRSRTIWICAGCYTCAVRCPNEINVTQLMDELRQEAAAAGVECPEPQVERFHRAFLRDVKRRGRIHELRLMSEFNRGEGKPLKDADLAPQLWLKGRLKLWPSRGPAGFRRWLKGLTDR